jgi:hypothetical protein
MRITKKSFWVLLAIILLIPLLTTIQTAFAHNSFGIQVKTLIDPYKDTLKQYEDELKSDKTSTEDKELLRKKYESISADATLRADIIKKEKPGAYETLLSATITPHAPIVEREVPDGIDKNPIIPNRMVFPKDFFPINGWHKKVESATLFVYSGYEIDDPSQGVIYLKEPGDTLMYKKFQAPQGSGKLQIVDEKNMRLTLQNEQGKVFYFDTIQEGFVDLDGNLI